MHSPALPGLPHRRPTVGRTHGGRQGGLVTLLSTRSLELTSSGHFAQRKPFSVDLAVRTRKENAMAEAVRSLERAFDLLEHLADAGGEMALSELTEVSGLPMPTIYRLMQTLVNRGYVRQEPSKRYALGPRLIRLGDGASRLLGTWARPVLAGLVDEIGETANMAVLEGDEA